MAVVCTGHDRNMTVTISGEVDHHGARQIMAELDRQMAAVLPRNITVDLGGVSFMDSSGIAVLLRAYQSAGRQGGGVTVVNVPDQAGRVLRAAGLQRLIRFA